MRGSVGGDDFDLVTAIGNLHGIEAVGFFCDFVFEQTPNGLTVTAKVERVDQFIAVVVVRGQRTVTADLSLTP